jgi:tellurite resistance protein TerC
VTPRRAIWLSVAWFAVGIAIGLPLLADSDRAAEYWAVYVLERSLSLDNVFVFLLVLDYFAIPRPQRLRVVRWGIVAALALRALAIAVGGVLIESFSVVTYLLGAVLLVFALRMLRGRDEPMDPAGSRVVQLVRRFVPSPAVLAVVALVVADLTFAVDSISAAFGITTDFLVIWLANALALMGLVPLLALVRALVQRFRYMSQTFAAVLVFIGARLLLEDVVSVGPLASLAAIAAILAAGLLASAIGDRLAPPPEHELAERRPPRCPPAQVGAR